MSNQKIILICSICLSRNYVSYKNKESTTKIEFRKHCSTCNKHTLHKETR